VAPPPFEDASPRTDPAIGRAFQSEVPERTQLISPFAEATEQTDPGLPLPNRAVPSARAAGALREENAALAALSEPTGPVPAVRAGGAPRDGSADIATPSDPNPTGPVPAIRARSTGVPLDEAAAIPTGELGGPPPETIEHRTRASGPSGRKSPPSGLALTVPQRTQPAGARAPQAARLRERAPQAPPPSPRETRSEPGALHVRPAALWRRLIACAVDSALWGALLYGYLVVAAKVAGAPSTVAPHGGLDAIAHRLLEWKTVLVPGVGVGLLLALAYIALFAFLLGGRSPGRLVTGLRLVDATGAPPRPPRATARALLALFWFGFLLAGLWWSLFDRRGQMLHDKLTGTFVVQAS
jgi:resuscitation-promoting factor RpfA